MSDYGDGDGDGDGAGDGAGDDDDDGASAADTLLYARVYVFIYLYRGRLVRQDIIIYFLRPRGFGGGVHIRTHARTRITQLPARGRNNISFTRAETE